MRIIEKTESRERCAEAGWYAWDLVLDQPMDDDFILSLRPLGSFVYLQTLAKPFFKTESPYRFIKGLLGDSFFRVAVHDEYRDKLAEVEALVDGTEPPPAA